MARIDEKVLWGAAEKLRDKCDPADYKNIVLGLVFLKYLSDKYNAQKKKLIAEGKDYNDKDYFTQDNVFVVPEKAQWSYVASFSKDPTLGQKIDAAFELLENENNRLKDILPKTYSKTELDQTSLGELVDFFTSNLIMDDADGDFFGQVYEYYIGAFATYIPQKGGEFFTPKSIVELMVEILQPFEGRVYDPCCGSGGMFVQCAKFVKEHQGRIDKISIYGQETNPGTWKMAKMNLAIRGIDGDLGPSSGDSFTNDMHKNLRADYILANPPYNNHDYWRETLAGDSRWIFGQPDKKNANYAWLELMYSKLAPKGKAAILMPNTATKSAGEDLKIREKMVEEGKIDAIVALPDKLFKNATLGVQCWILDRGKTDKNILFINGLNLGKMINRKTRILCGSTDDENFNKNVDVNEIDLISSTYHKYKKKEGYKNIPEFCYSAPIGEIKEKKYDLNPGKYVGAKKSEKTDDERINIEIKEKIKEIYELIDKNEKLEVELKEILNKEF